ncbi:MAG: ABC transporter permease subunit [Aromatoleum sp.]|jgi:NitT/TauT family transport system permease protein|uniref:ABC transporter permease n=1 Tax=Aromatoleum sp. TaxID=2307007 RepID=UPI002893EF89|nr:ABC transporter permease subunit [Aromatoleum sp.]MDT3670352.1 ABC transporter permease subunit [Aromatoleum sp.]
MSVKEAVVPLALRQSLSCPEQVERPLGLGEKLYNIPALRKLLLLAAVAAVWQVYAANVGNPLLFPGFSATLQAWWDGLTSGVLVMRAAFSLKILLVGYAAGIVLAALLSGFAAGSRLGGDLLETLTAMFSPLPAIALLPLALLWFGLGDGSLVFVLVHSVVWPVSLSMHSGFKAVSPTLRMVGRNYGLSGPGYVIRILVPAAFPSVLSGLKNGWAFAWRTLIAAELVFGVSSGSGGLGWFIYEKKNQLEIPSVFAGLLTVILIGLAVENLVFRTIESRTVRRWGMQG